LRGFTIRRGRKGDSEQFVALLRALAKFEHLHPPSGEGEKRLLDDVFRRRRVHLFVATQGERLAGYALYYYSYSSFVAKPTLYLEDIFVLEEHRKLGVGFALFKRCVKEAITKGCGRMEWAVLDWNVKAQRFYEKLGARRLSEWYFYRLDQEALKRVPK
jgi:GNAT superfamily N-acetyltransferase